MPRPVSFGRVVCAAMVLAGLPGCRLFPEDVLAPVDGAAAGTRPVELLVATTRAAHPDPAVVFSDQRGDGLAFTRFSVSIPPGHRPGRIDWPRSRPPNPAREMCVVAREPLAAGAAMDWVARRQSPSARRHGVVVMVHGYNTGFAGGVLRYSQFLHDARLPVTPILFSWPSMGKLHGYGYDRESAAYSRDGLEELLVRLDAEPGVHSISMVAHSMGNWLTMETLRQMSRSRPARIGKIRDVVLAAPDIDLDNFRQQIQRVRATSPVIPRFTVFSSRDDVALRAASKVWGDVPRLGSLDHGGGDHAHWLSKNGVQVIDVSDLDAGDPVGHTRFANAPVLVRRIGTLVAEGQLETGPKPGLGETLASGATRVTTATAGAITRVATTPLSMTDAAGRERLGEGVARWWRPKKQPGQPPERAPVDQR